VYKCCEEGPTLSLQGKHERKPGETVVTRVLTEEIFSTNSARLSFGEIGTRDGPGVSAERRIAQDRDDAQIRQP